MRLSLENSHRIANMSFICACLVVVAHTLGASNPPACPWLRILRDVFALVPVAFFFCVSGFMLARHIGEANWWRQAVNKRMKSLLVPYVVWMAVCIAILWLLTGQRPIGFNNSGLNLAKTPLLVPLWFVRALFLFVLLSPMIHRPVTHHGSWFLCALFIGTLLLPVAMRLCDWQESMGVGGVLTYGLPIRGLFCFSFGLWLARRPTASQRMPSVVRTIWHAIPSTPWPRCLTQSAFAIYIVHAIVLGAIWCIPSVNAFCPIWLTSLLGIAIPILVYNALSKLCPRIACIVFGGR